MKHLKFTSLIVLAALFLSSCGRDRVRIRPSSNISTFETTTDPFDELEVHDAFEVYVHFTNATEYIEVEANDNLHDYIEIENFGGRLEIGMEDGVRIAGNAHLKVNIYTNFVHTYDVSGASYVKLESPWGGGDLKIDLSGASAFKAFVDAGDIDIDLSGASECDLSGETNTMNAELSGASELQDYDMEVEYLFMDLSGASTAKLTVNKSIQLDASGASTLYYRGNPNIESLNLSGASNIKKD